MIENELSSTDENQAGKQLTTVEAAESTPILPALVLAVLVAAVIVAYLLYQPFQVSALLSSSHPARIVFMSDRDDNWEIYMVDRDGSNLVNLTNSPGNDGLPLHAPGKNQLVFASDRDESQLDLFLMDLEEGTARNFTQTPTANELPITWSPTSEHLVFATDQSGSTEIVLTSITGEASINLSQRDGAQNFDDWSPQTDRFILTISLDQSVALVTTDLAGDAPQALTDGSYPAAGGRWSPNSQAIAFMAMLPEMSGIDILVLDLTSGETTNLTQSSSNERFPRWSPDGSKIAFLSDRDGNPEIYVIDANGSNLTNLTNNPANESAQGDFAWSPDGNQILFHSDRDGNVEVYLMDADGSNQTNLSNAPGLDYYAIWVQ